MSDGWFVFRVAMLSYFTWSATNSYYTHRAVSWLVYEVAAACYFFTVVLIAWKNKCQSGRPADD